MTGQFDLRGNQCITRIPRIFSYKRNRTLIMDSSKRRADVAESVQVIGFGRPWRFSYGITAGEVIDFMAHKLDRPAKDIAIEDTTGSFIVSRQTELLLGHRYVFTLVRKPDTAPKRTFAVGGITDPQKHYYVPPDVTQLVDKLKHGKYCVLCGARQSGKSTMAMAVKRELSLDPDICVVYLDKVSVDKSWSRNRFWAALCDHLHGKCADLFPARLTGEECTDWSFRSLFLVKNLPIKVTLIIDEADALLSASPDCLDDFFSTLKGIRDDDDYNFNGVLLVGVETVKDLLEAQYLRRPEDAAELNRVYVPSSAPSLYSPFSYSFLSEPVRFLVGDVENLLQQAQADLQGVQIEIERIATSVIELTGGHKGIVGSCLDYLVDRELWTSRQWIEATDSFHLSTYVFGQQTYSKILSAFKKGATGRDFDLLLSFLKEDKRHCNDQMVILELRNLIAQGVLIAQEAKPDGYDVRISSPMLRSIILRRCVITSGSVDPPAQALRVDPLWVVFQAIRTLDGEALCRPECIKRTGELSKYSYQFMLFTRIKAVLTQAYPLVDAKLVPKAKIAAEYLDKRDTQERLDILVRNNDNFSKFGCELVVNDDVEGYVSKAERYAKQHSAQVFVINVTMEDSPILVVPEHGCVVFLSVQLFPSGNKSRAKVTMVETSDVRTDFELEMKNWDGKISFDYLV
ncbi:uncharacterized protein LOC9641177 [Selaginella moellendorffii]|uniref:uncharacterized protein LOC9641177 n=1 Tax=Selaginella moellendorffii TaxID=88036 RepID=UPI000D1D0E37|nr:uncharacterized protein LOC9641177 [Selaginella moellendorffii]|eukprot:XP_024523847.1 uncharacterized protein LOC9641177 [Selaginella moellendorffii]